MSSGLIGMNVDLGDSMVSSLGSQGNNAQERLRAAQQRVDALLSTWQGTSRQGFEGDWTSWVQQMNDLITQLEEMRNRLRQTVEGFRSADVY